jgi:hypothetical protein
VSAVILLVEAIALLAGLAAVLVAPPPQAPLAPAPRRGLTGVAAGGYGLAAVAAVLGELAPFVVGFGLAAAAVVGLLRFWLHDEPGDDDGGGGGGGGGRGPDHPRDPDPLDDGPRIDWPAFEAELRRWTAAHAARERQTVVGSRR